ncbi:MAG: cyclic nucleotide-binding domain-containing protein [Anaerolineaceae bacterium]
MSYEDLDRILGLLEQLYIFEGIPRQQLIEIASRFESMVINRGERIFSEGDEGDEFYLISSGRVLITKADRHRQRVLAILSEGDYFGEEALLYDRPRSASAVALEKTVLLCLNSEHFNELLREYPLIHRNLSITAESRYLARKGEFEWLAEDELIYLVTRKHEIFLILSLLIPIFIGVISLPIAGLSFVASTPFLKVAVLIFGLAGIFIAVIWAIWKWLDWENDYYIVTSRRVVWQEKVIGMYASRREAPLANILSVNVSSSQLGRILNYGDVEVRTYTGGIYMRKVSQPYLLEAYIRGYQERARQRQEKEEIKANEEALHKRMAELEGYSQNSGKPSSTSSTIPTRTASPEKPISQLWKLLKTLFTVRYEENGAIIYRKHWLVLLKKTWKPLLLFIILLITTGLISWRLVSNQPVIFSGWVWVLVLLFLYILTFFWWDYQFLDWTNDIYKITPDQILDIERKPLGTEEKKSASLDSILSLEHTRNGILQLIFNYGDVIVNVGQSQFVFKGVNNPDQVHQDVADYMEARERKKREEQVIRERQRMVNWFDIYHQETEKFDNSANDENNTKNNSEEK